MKTLKPMRLGVLTRPFENERKYYLSIGVLVFFPFDDPDYLLPDIALWKLSASELGSEGILDECMPKSSAEVLLSAKAFPKNPPQGSCHVRFQMETTDRTLYIFGDRTWGFIHPSDPEPFESMPISYSRAFGGEGFALNPIGKGYASIQTPQGSIRPLPNIEHPKQIIASPNDRPEPAGFMPLPITSPLRQQKVGTYDDAWLKERYPGFPADFDWTFFNVAPETQRFKGFLKGGESFVCENMHPEQSSIRSRLPTGIARCFLQFKGQDTKELREVSTKIDTLWLFPHAERGLVIYRGVVPVQEDDAADISHLMIAYEAQGKPKTKDHYQSVFQARIHFDTAAAVLRDRDLLPELPKRPPCPEEKTDMDGLISTNRLVLENARRGAQKRLDQVRTDIQRIIDEAPPGATIPQPDLSLVPQTVPEMMSPPTLEEIPDLVEQAIKDAEEKRKEAMAKVAEAEAQARKLCSENNLNYDELVEKEKDRELRRRRRYSAQTHFDNFRELIQMAENAGADTSELRASLEDPELIKKFVDMEAKLNEAYAKIVHYLPPTLAEGDPILRSELEEGAAQGKTFAGRDFSNADFSGLNLQNIDFEGACLESAKLGGANLQGANLKYAILTRADLTGANLKGADMSHANLGSTILRNADASQAKLIKAVLSKADFQGARFAGADLCGADFMESHIEDADFSDAQLNDLVFFRPTLKRLNLTGASLSKASFIEGQFEDIDLSGAKAQGAIFIGISAQRIRFDGADLRSARLLKESAFPGASFIKARMEGFNARGCNLQGANLSDSDLSKADFSEANLQEANLCRVHANDAVFVRSDLRKAQVEESVFMQAILQKADVSGASFKDSNLFRADAMGMRGDKDTSFQGAFVKRVRNMGKRG